ncbi:unnamed protein product, partial [Cylicocyclus nassatus]
WKSPFSTFSCPLSCNFRISERNKLRNPSNRLVPGPGGKVIREHVREKGAGVQAKRPRGSADAVAPDSATDKLCTYGDVNGANCIASCTVIRAYW